MRKYKGVTFMYMAFMYKLYKSIFIEKLIKAINKKLRKTQLGFQNRKKNGCCVRAELYV